MNNTAWLLNRENRGEPSAYKVLTVSLSPPSEPLAELVNLAGFRAVRIGPDSDLIPAFRRVQPDLLLLSPGISEDQIDALTGVLGNEKDGFPVLCISDCKETARKEQLCDGVNLAFLPKSFELKDLKKAIERMVRASINPVENCTKELDELIIGSTPAMMDLKRRICQVAKSELTVLIEGESGTGKEVVAKAIHSLSERKRKPFVKVNSAGFPTELFESELFGYKKGAFTGAYQTKPGKFDLADSGTIFLDEVGEIPLASQAKLLHVLEDSEFSPLGSTTNTRVDTRVLAATNAGLNRMVNEKTFRLDLYYRLSVVSLYIPPLRDRKEDIPVLCDHFLKKYAHHTMNPITTISGEIKEQFQRCDWPGNVRQLENAVRSVVALGNADGVLPASTRPMKKYTLKEVCKEAVGRAEKKIIEEVLFHTGWNRKEAATVLRTSYRNLLNKIKEYDIAQAASVYTFPSQT